MPGTSSPVTFHGQPCLELSLPSGDHVRIALHGAQVLSWRTGDGREHLYLSPKAVFDGKTAIRGGMPICFPQFNQRVIAGRSLPKHGFARSLPWRVGACSEGDSEALASLRLSEADLPDALRQTWPFRFEAQVEVKLESGSLSLSFGLHNTDRQAWPFALALHTYFQLDDLAATRLEGLQGRPYWDAVTLPGAPEQLQPQAEALLGFAAETDRVYSQAPSRLTLNQPDTVLHIAQSGHFTETVVWNPGATLCAQLADMPEDGYRHMLCVEAARINEPVLLEAGATWQASQVLRVAPVAAKPAPGPHYTRVVAPLPSTVPFVGPETQERQRGRPFKARIGANENVFGPSPKAVAAMQEAAAGSWMYGDPENHDLKQALARHLGVGPENIVVGEGIDSLFGYTVRMLVEPGDPVVSSLGAYPTFNFHVNGFGGQLLTVPYVDDREDPASLLALAKGLGPNRPPRLIYFSNPDNPMGTWWPAADVQRLIDEVPAGSVLVLDEAYGEFAPPGTMPELDVSNPSVIRYRTFSKAWGLAGARIAYAIAEASVARSFDKIRNHFSVNRLAQAAALASLQDTAHLAATLAKVSAARERIARIALANGLKPLPSATNFVAIDCLRDGVFAKRVLDELIKRDIFVRMPGVAPLNRAIRISAGTAADLDWLEQQLPEALAAARA